jgi:tetratricopeptide (TPR) repeat protein
MWRLGKVAGPTGRVGKLVSSTSTLPIAALAVAVLAIAALGAHAPLAGQEEPSLRDGLGNHHFELSTDVEAARTWFDQGFRLTYAFEHAEAVEAFRRATELDPGCAMCWWGIAWASGPNINAGMDSAGAEAAREAIWEARDHLDGTTERERAYVKAMSERYGPDPMRDRASQDTAYARAMRDVAERWPSDDDAQVLASEALMLLSPWDYWTEEGEPRSGTRELLQRLRTVTERNREHAGACHFYIHAVEAAHPERALPCADRIADLMPGAGHVVHMPGHVYIRVGRYADAVEANGRALRADSAAASERRDETAYTLAYHPHNYHFLSYAAAMAGQREVALEAARKLEGAVDREMMRQPGFAALQHYLVTPLRVMVRFGMWEAILAESAPPDDLLYPTGTWRYARAMAFVRTGRLEQAVEELEWLRGVQSEPALEEERVWDLNATAALLAVAVKLVEGELAAARGDYDEAVGILEEGLRRESDLVYDEPPPWHLPVRHVLGAVLLEAGRAAEAETVYRKALQRFPENGYALKGLVQSLEEQGRSDEAEAARERFREAWRAADVELPASRY